MEICRKYHPKSEVKDLAGYYPNFKPKHNEAVEQLRELIKENKIELIAENETEQPLLKLLRFLRARNFNPNKAFQMLKDDIAWRAAENRVNMRKETAAEVLQCDLSAFFGYYPSWIQGTDRQSRPVAWRKFGKCEIWSIMKLTTMERLTRFHAWETEQLLRIMSQRSQEQNVNIETFVLVIDAGGWHMGLATRDAFTFIKNMASIDSDHYPERLGQMVVINAPSALSFAWRMISGFLDDMTKQKIRIMSTEQSSWLPVLLEIMDEDQIPAQYGGKAPDLSAEESIQSMNPPSP